MRSLFLMCFALAIGGCAPDARLVFAENSVRVASRAFAEAETSGGEHPALETSLAAVARRLRQTERALELWRDHSGPLAYRTFAPCLRAALLALRADLVREDVTVPRELDEAEAILAEVGGRCGRSTASPAPAPPASPEPDSGEPPPPESARALGAPEQP